MSDNLLVAVHVFPISVLTLPLLPGLLWLGFVEPVKVSSMGQIELFNHLLRIILLVI